MTDKWRAPELPDTEFGRGDGLLKDVPLYISNIKVSYEFPQQQKGTTTCKVFVQFDDDEVIENGFTGYGWDTTLQAAQDWVRDTIKQKETE